MNNNKMPAMVAETMTGGARLGAIADGYNNKSTTDRRSVQAPTRQARSLLFWATKYASDLGWPVVPVLDKVPAAEHGHTDATNDVEALGELFAARAHNGFGVRGGGPLRLVPIEIDERNHVKTGSRASFHRVAGVRLGEYKTPSYHTPNGARMICYAPSDLDLDFGELELAPGISAFGSGKQVVLPPSQHPSGKQYGPYYPGLDPWSVDVAPLPAALVELIRAARPRTTARAQTHEHSAAGGADLELVADALNSIDPWLHGYHWWLRILMALHSEFPGVDGKRVAVAWACGKPGEVERLWDKYFKTEGNRAGKVGIGTLFREAKLAGWVRPAAEPVNLPWAITKADWDSCSICRNRSTALLDDGSIATGPDFCRNPKCRVQQKRKMGKALRPVLDYTGIRSETVPGIIWRQWRENMKRAGRRYTAIPLPGGSRLCLVETEAQTDNLDGLLTAAAEAWTHKPASGNKVPCNVSHEHKAKPKPDVDALPPKPRAKVVERWCLSQPEQRRALLDALGRLHVPYERRAFGGWRTAPLDDETRDLLHLELLAVPGVVSLPSTTSNSYSGTTGNIHASWGEDLPHTEAEIPGYAVRNRVNVNATSPVKRSKRLSRAKRAADGRKRDALNRILRTLEAKA